VKVNEEKPETEGFKIDEWGFVWNGNEHCETFFSVYDIVAIQRDTLLVRFIFRAGGTEISFPDEDTAKKIVTEIKNIKIEYAKFNDNERQSRNTVSAAGVAMQAALVKAMGVT